MTEAFFLAAAHKYDVLIATTRAVVVMHSEYHKQLPLAATLVHHQQVWRAASCGQACRLRECLLHPFGGDPH